MAISDDPPAASKQLVPVTIDATESGVTLRLAAVRAADGNPAVEFSGRLQGPSCSVARTLSTSYDVGRMPSEAAGGVVAEVFVADPCYWTPALPFLYRLMGEVVRADGSTSSLDRVVGLRRLRVERASFRLEGERTVFRGAGESSVASSQLDEARAAGTMLIVSELSDELCGAADKVGVGLLADLRSEGGDIGAILRRLAWHPSVMAVVLDGPSTALGRAAGMLTANAVRAELEPTPPSDPRRAANLYVVEVSPGERPPAWVATSRRPTIAVRRGAVYADLQGAREACERLQAELAPQFDLAGYFVSRE